MTDRIDCMYCKHKGKVEPCNNCIAYNKFNNDYNIVSCDNCKYSDKPPTHIVCLNCTNKNSFEPMTDNEYNLLDIIQEKPYKLTNIVFENDYSYIHCTTVVDGYNLETLFRVTDIENGEDNKLVSIDYGFKHPIISECWQDIEKELIDHAKLLGLSSEDSIFRDTVNRLERQNMHSERMLAIAEYLQDEFYINTFKSCITVNKQLGYLAPDIKELEDRTYKRMKQIYNAVFKRLCIN